MCSSSTGQARVASCRKKGRWSGAGKSALTLRWRCSHVNVLEQPIVYFTDADAELPKDYFPPM